MSVNYLLIFNLLASAALLGHSACMLNRMTHRSNHFSRIGYVVLAVGSAGVLLGPIYGLMRPQLPEVISNAGAASVLITGWFYQNRRSSDQQEHAL